MKIKREFSLPSRFSSHRLFLVIKLYGITTVLRLLIKAVLQTRNISATFVPKYPSVYSISVYITVTDIFRFAQHKRLYAVTPRHNPMDKMMILRLLTIVNVVYKIMGGGGGN